MSEPLNYISELYKNVDDEGPIPLIENTVVEEAIAVVKDMSFKETESLVPVDSLFYYLSALALLNAAIKHQYKGRIHYGFIKLNAKKVAEYVINHKEEYTEASVYYRKEEKKENCCLFLKVHDVVFSFHHIEEDDTILSAVEFEPIEWTGIKLKYIAQPLFLYARDTVQG